MYYPDRENPYRSPTSQGSILRDIFPFFQQNDPNSKIEGVKNKIYQSNALRKNCTSFLYFIQRYSHINKNLQFHY